MKNCGRFVKDNEVLGVFINGSKDGLFRQRSRFHLKLPHNELCGSKLIGLFTN